MKRLDPFLMALIGAVVLASFFPCHGTLSLWLSNAVTALIALMFFFQGAKLERKAIVESVRDWRLQGSVLLCTFAIFPLLGIALHHLFTTLSPDGLIGEGLWSGILFVCCLPSTVQSSIALTSIARGNIPASICAATMSNIAGIILTPILAGLLLGSAHNSGSSPLHAILDVGKELLLPFLLGQIVQKWLGPIVKKHKFLISMTDRGSIVLVVYTAFSAAVTEGIWHRVSIMRLVEITAINFILLTFILMLSRLLGRKMSLENSISLQLCGSKKSLASGVPMASVIFPASTVGIIVLPLMIYHQIQLFTCTLLARQYGKR
nr:bile acid:sodium symporter family protein [uncultured Neokomagataea sp.]